MRNFFFLLLLCYLCLLFPAQTHAVPMRYADCDSCGLCRNTTKSGNVSTDPTVYVQPAQWYACFQCLYPELNPTPPATLPTGVPCQQDEMGRQINFEDISGNGIGDPLLFRCDTILMAPYVSDQTNGPTIVPQSGRMFSDLGCISVKTSAGAFSDPNASVDVIQKLLDLVISATGAVGTILVMASAVRLILSKGDPEKIREGKKTLTNVVLGLLFTLFGLFIFRFFAAQVLRIPGFN
jgi:hypothetical protein